MCATIQRRDVRFPIILRQVVRHPVLHSGVRYDTAPRCPLPLYSASRRALPFILILHAHVHYDTSTAPRCALPPILHYVVRYLILRPGACALYDTAP